MVASQGIEQQGNLFATECPGHDPPGHAYVTIDF